MVAYRHEPPNYLLRTCTKYIFVHIIILMELGLINASMRMEYLSKDSSDSGNTWNTQQTLTFTDEITVPLSS